MSRVVEIRNCVDCPHRKPILCELERRRITAADAYLEFPVWCPLPEKVKEEESDAKG